MENSHHVGSGVSKSHVRSLQFHPVCTWSLSDSPVPPRAVVLCSPLGLSIKAFSRGSFSTPQSLAGIQTWVSSTTRGQKVTFGDCLHTLFKGIGAKGEVTWELTRGRGTLVHLSLLADPIFRQSPLSGGFSSIYTWGRHVQSFYRGLTLG